MKLDYDAATDSLYIHLVERPSVDSDEVADGVVLDYDAAGALVGIDVQHASQRADVHSAAGGFFVLNDLRLSAGRSCSRDLVRPKHILLLAFFLQ